MTEATSLLILAISQRPYGVLRPARRIRDSQKYRPPLESEPLD